MNSEMHQHRTALVTGGNRGIGLAICRGLAKLGFRVLLACRDTDKGLAAARGIEGTVFVVELDLANSFGLDRQLNSISESFGAVDVVINNAGILDYTKFSELTTELTLRSLQTNALAALAVIQHFAPQMQQRKFGRIVNLSSGWGSFYEGLEGPPAYAISKATLNAITKVAASSYPDWVKINAMCPGWVRTDMGGNEADRSVEEGADTVLWLATLEADGPSGGFFRDRKSIEW